jgi:sporulation protein YlmC with PRC-barrel domain
LDRDTPWSLVDDDGAADRFGRRSAAVGTRHAPQAILVGSDSLVGGTVRDNEGRDIGKVSRLMIDPNDGRITSIIIATGGTLGVGSNTISVPWSSVKIGQDRGKLIVTASQTLDSAPVARAPRPNKRPASN